MLETELLVVGGGVAGAYATLTARSYGADVLLACKTPLVGGSTRWAQGGIAAPLAHGDEDAHAQDTVKAGRGLCEPEAVQAFVRDARSHVETLRDLGVTFSPHATLEGGHSRARIRHQGDATGHAISVALADKIDQLAGFFAVGEKPTGSGDPFALRRAARALRLGGPFLNWEAAPFSRA